MTVRINSNIARFHLFVNNWIWFESAFGCLFAWGLFRAMQLTAADATRSIVFWQHRVREILHQKDVRLRILAADCRSFSRTARSTAVPESVYNWAIGRSPGITAVKSTTFTVASISANLNPDIKLKKVSVSILGHKQQNFWSVGQKFHRSIKEQYFILGRSRFKPVTYVLFAAFNLKCG